MPKNKVKFLGFQIKERETDDLVDFMAKNEVLPIGDCLRWIEADNNWPEWRLEAVWDDDGEDHIQITLDKDLKKQIAVVSARD